MHAQEKGVVAAALYWGKDAKSVDRA